MKDNKERSYLFDNIKVILIFFVVSAHYTRVSGSFNPDNFGGFFYIVAFSFIMQGFLFVSGYFSKNVDKCRQGAVQNFLFPYLLLMPAMFAIRLLIFGEASFDLLQPTFALWFLLVMFIYRFFIKDLGKVPGIVPLSIVLFLASGCFSSLGEELALGRICSFFIFFILGYKMEKKDIERIRKVNKKITVAVLIGLVSFSYVLACSELIPVEMWHFKDGYSIYHVGNLTGIGIRLLLGCISLAWLFVIINLTPDRKVFFSRIGRCTLTIYVCHIPVRYLIKYVDLPGDGNAATFLIGAAAVVATIWLFSRPAVVNTYNNMMDFIYDKTVIKIKETVLSVRRGIKNGLKSTKR